MAHMRQVKRQRIMWNMQGRAQFTGRRACRTIFDQQTKHTQAGFLRQRTEGGKSLINVHMSRLLDILGLSQVSMSNASETGVALFARHS